MGLLIENYGGGRMTYFDQKQNHIKYAIAAVAVVSCILFAVATFLEWDVAYNCASPVVSFSSALLIYKSLDSIGLYRKVAIWFMIGILVWFLGDIMWIIQNYVTPDNSVIETITDNLYLIPDYFYVGGLVSYAGIRFRKNDFQLLMVDTFVLTIIAFVTSQCAFEHANSLYKINLENLNTILYYFVSVFTLLMVVLVIYKSGLKRHVPAYYVIIISLLLNNALEIRYTAKLLVGQESESEFLDILYLVFMVLFALGFAFGKLDKVNFEQESRLDNRESHIRKHFSRIYWVNALVLVLTAVILFMVKFFDSQDVFIFIMVSMAYVIMCKTLLTNMLSEELIQQQKNENARLEQMVEDKTRELREMNAHLEKISNTDVLTGLYNRRYGMDYLEGLIKDAENYPIAMYSLDLNYFKPINDNYGHDMGDVVLKEVGRRLANLGQKRCTAIRVGGDEFLVIFRNASNLQAVENVGRLICDRMDEPIEAHLVTEEKGEQNHTFQISASIGVARFPSDTADLDTLLKMADQALYRIKHTHEKSAYLLFSSVRGSNVLSALKGLKESGEEAEEEEDTDEETEE